MSHSGWTGSRKLVENLNRLGQCINYSVLEELETASAEAIQDRKLHCPDGTFECLPMRLAFDNYDELTDTLSGKDTLHDTMGILYQNVPAVLATVQPVQTTETQGTGPSSTRPESLTKKRLMTTPISIYLSHTMGSQR